jgi:HTH-type transcriptional regulator / antitoxin HigA
MSDPVVPLMPVGQILGAEIEDRGWTQADFAAVLGRPTQFVSEIINGKKEITRESAAQIAAALGHSPGYWLKLQDDYLLYEQAQDSLTQRKLCNVRRRARLNDLAPMSVLLKRGIIRGRTLDDQEAEIMELYELKDMSDDPEFILAARRSNPSEILSALQLAWVASVRRAARTRKPPVPYSAPALARLAAKLPHILTAPARFRDLPDILAQVGVRLVYVEALPGAKIDGCAFFLGGTPVIALSGRGKRMDKILFTLLHEIAHLVLRHVKADEIQIIVEEVEQHDSDSATERAANQRAGSWILQQPLPYIQERINQAWVTRIAAERGLAPIVIIGQLQNLKRLDWHSTLAKNAPTVTEELASW